MIIMTTLLDSHFLGHPVVEIGLFGALKFIKLMGGKYNIWEGVMEEKIGESPFSGSD